MVDPSLSLHPATIPYAWQTAFQWRYSGESVPPPYPVGSGSVLRAHESSSPISSLGVASRDRRASWDLYPLMLVSQPSRPFGTITTPHKQDTLLDDSTFGSLEIEDNRVLEKRITLFPPSALNHHSYAEECCYYSKKGIAC